MSIVRGAAARGAGGGAVHRFELQAALTAATRESLILNAAVARSPRRIVCGARMTVLVDFG